MDNIKGIRLLGGEAQQMISLFANNSSLTILGEEMTISTLIGILEDIRLATSLETNWNKSVVVSIVLK